MNNGDTPAMPTVGLDRSGIKLLTTNQSGLTKREHFAAMALQGMLGNGSFIYQCDDNSAKWVAAAAVKCADALLAELETPK